MASKKQKTATLKDDRVEALTQLIKERYRHTLDTRTYIYLIQCDIYFKIGYAFQPKYRLHSMQAGSPYELKLLLAEKVSDHKKVEAELHEMFKRKKHRGEWFKLNAKDIIKLYRWITSEEANPKTD